MDKTEILERKAGLKRLSPNVRASDNCIFCKQNSHSSKSIEHIIPESLGNSKHTLPVGVVCDKCNNYFARKIEGPLLETVHFKNLRSRQELTNKKGKIPLMHGFLLGVNKEIQMNFFNPPDIALKALYDRDTPIIGDYLMSRKKATFIIPQTATFDQQILSRFLAKVALEMVAHKFCAFEGWQEDMMFRPEFDAIRDYARFNTGVKYWPFYEREIYDENRVLKVNGDCHQTLHEFDLLYTKQGEMYAIICIFGTEYTINLVGPELDGYRKWLESHNFSSYLYMDKKDVYGDASEYPLLPSD